MKVVLDVPPWGSPIPTKELMEATNIIGSGTTAKAKAQYNQIKRKGESVPKGMQSTINKLLDAKFEQAGWTVKDGRYTKNGTYVRVTFRHAMSLGTDVLDAMKACAKDGVELVALFACGLDALRTIAPTQATSMVSYEKLVREVNDLNGVIDIPLIIGELIPKSL